MKTKKLYDSLHKNISNYYNGKSKQISQTEKAPKFWEEKGGPKIAQSKRCSKFADIYTANLIMSVNLENYILSDIGNIE